MSTTNEAEQVVEKYEDLESEICEMLNMSYLTISYIEDRFSGPHRLTKVGDRDVIAITERDADIILFSVYKIETITKELKAKFYSIGEGKSS